MSTIGRNDPCPCGSGKKYKKCCWLTGALTPSFTKEDATTAWNLLLTVFDDDAYEPEYETASEDFYSLVSEEVLELIEGDPESDAVSLEFLDMWFLLDRKTRKGDRPVDRVLAGEIASDRVRSALQAFAAVKQGVYRVLAVVPKRSVTLRDLRSGAEVLVEDPVMAGECEVDEVLSFRLMPAAPQRPAYAMSTLIGLSDEQQAELLIDIADVTKDIVDEGGQPSDADSDIPPLVHSHWALDAEAMLDFDDEGDDDEDFDEEDEDFEVELDETEVAGAEPVEESPETAAKARPWAARRAPRPTRED